MDYVTHKRFKGKTISGDMNIPAKTECVERDGMIYLGDKAICATKSACAHKYFTRNDDGNGILRGKLTRSIQEKLAADTGCVVHQRRWDLVWEDKLCAKYRNTEHGDHWLWNHDFYNAEITDLQYIAGLVGAKGVF